MMHACTGLTHTQAQLNVQERTTDMQDMRSATLTAVCTYVWSCGGICAGGDVCLCICDSRVWWLTHAQIGTEERRRYATLLNNIASFTRSEMAFSTYVCAVEVGCV